MRFCCAVAAVTFSFPLCFCHFCDSFLHSIFILVFTQFTIRSSFTHRSRCACSLEIWTAYLVCMHVVSEWVCLTCLAFSSTTLRYSHSVCVLYIWIAWAHAATAVAALIIVIPIQYHTARSKSQPQISFSLLLTRVHCLFVIHFVRFIGLVCVWKKTILYTHVFWIDEEHHFHRKYVHYWMTSCACTLVFFFTVFTKCWSVCFLLIFISVVFPPHLRINRCDMQNTNKENTWKLGLLLEINSLATCNSSICKSIPVYTCSPLLD